jgi:protoheme IX farnesyltransferase
MAATLAKADAFNRLTVVFSAWALLLVFASTINRATYFSHAIALTEHLVIGGITVLLALAVSYVIWRRCRGSRLLFGAGLASVGLALSYLIIGAVTVMIGDHPVTTAVLLTTAMLILGIALFLTSLTRLPAENIDLNGPSSVRHNFYLRTILLTGAGLLILFTTGIFVAETGTGTACPDWPLCRGEIFPANIGLGVAINLLHRFSVVLLAGLVVAVILQTRRQYRNYRLLTAWSWVLGLLFLAQIAVGGAYVFVELPAVVKALHGGLSAAIWSNVIVLASISYLTLESLFPDSGTETVAEPVSLPLRNKAKTFFKLTKPWILVLLLITTITAMFIAAEGLPSLSLVLYTMLGGALAASGASVLNSYLDSDIDHLMSRTSRRATVTGLVTPQETLVFGLTLSIISFLVFAIFVNMLSAILSTLGIFYYVFFYTLYLKRTTIHNIIIGGAAGAIPPLVGWTAVTNSLGLGALYLFAIIFFWTPPHTWALALLVKKDYAQARVPMLPVVVGEKETTKQILLYTILLITLTLLPYSFDMLSPVYLATAIALGIPFIYLAWKLWRDYSKGVSKRLYKFSQAYLALLFLAMAVDRSLF